MVRNGGITSLACVKIRSNSNSIANNRLQIVMQCMDSNLSILGVSSSRSESALSSNLKS